MVDSLCGCLQHKYVINDIKKKNYNAYDKCLKRSFDSEATNIVSQAPSAITNDDQSMIRSRATMPVTFSGYIIQIEILFTR